MHAIIQNLRRRQGVPLSTSDMPALASFLSLDGASRASKGGGGEEDNGGSESSSDKPYHQVVGRIRQAQRDSAHRQRWKDDEKYCSRVQEKSLGFRRPGSPRLGYGTHIYSSFFLLFDVGCW